MVPSIEKIINLKWRQSCCVPCGFATDSLKLARRRRPNAGELPIGRGEDAFEPGHRGVVGAVASPQEIECGLDSSSVNIVRESAERHLPKCRFVQEAGNQSARSFDEVVV